MAYDRVKLEKQIIEAIEREELTFFSEIVLFVKPALSTLYEMELEKSETIKAALEANKLRQKAKMRKKWVDSDNATLQISAYKLIADNEELEKLTMNKVDACVKGDLNIKWAEIRNYGADDKTNEGS
jgi:hypothetical protein